jgi:hypothetical protein
MRQTKKAVKRLETANGIKINEYLVNIEKENDRQ